MRPASSPSPLQTSSQVPSRMSRLRCALQLEHAEHHYVNVDCLRGFNPSLWGGLQSLSNNRAGILSLPEPLRVACLDVLLGCARKQFAHAAA